MKPKLEVISYQLTLSRQPWVSLILWVMSKEVFFGCVCTEASLCRRSIFFPVTRMTMQLYSSIVKDLPPTPSKFHYIFNLRDLSRIYHGLCLSTPDKFSKIGSFIRLWYNETCRVICDRLINVADGITVKVRSTASVDRDSSCR